MTLVDFTLQFSVYGFPTCSSRAKYCPLQNVMLLADRFQINKRLYILSLAKPRQIAEKKIKFIRLVYVWEHVSNSICSNVLKTATPPHPKCVVNYIFINF